MSRVISTRTAVEPERPLNLVIDNFKAGAVTLVDQAIAPSNSMVVSLNMMQVMDGRWATRWGTGYYGSDAGGVIEGIGRFVNPSDGRSHLVAVVQSGGYSVIKRSTDDGLTWTTVTYAGADHRTLNKQPFFLQFNSQLYCTNSYDNIVRYDGSTTLVPFTVLATPTGLTVTRPGGLSAGSFILSYSVTAINEVGETLAITAVSPTGGVNIARNQWKNDPTTADTQYLDLLWNRVTGATRYIIYMQGDQIADRCKLIDVADPGTGSTVTYRDNGKADTTPFIVEPTVNTTQGPKFGPMELSGNRPWATKDKDNAWRVWWGGTFPHMGAFNPAYDGGYVDLELGGAEHPQQVVHYRDGKGGSFATILTSDPEGNGSIWQVSLDTIQVGNYSYTQPVPTKIVGSVGTIAPLSVVKVKNDVMFFNRRGEFTLGSKAQMLNLLSTDEITANIRDQIRGLRGTALGGVASAYYDAKVFLSVPAGADYNNVIYVNDTERRNWAGPWTFGVRQFLVYADNSGNNHFLGVPSNGSQLIEISSAIAGDLGVAFDTALITPLIPIYARDRTQFAKVERAYMELAHPVGTVNFTILGTDRKGKYSARANFSMTGPLGDAGYGTELFSAYEFSDTTFSPVIQSSVISRKYLKVRKKLNNIQFKLTTTEIGANYTLLTLQAKGFMVEGRDPTIWKK